MITRREHLGLMGAAGLPAAQSAPSDWERAVVKRHDEGVARLLEGQLTATGDPNRGAYPDAYGLHYPGTASGLIDSFNAAFHHPLSKFHKSALIVDRLRLAAGFFERSLTADGNIDLPITNFNSPPDTAFAVLNLATAMHIARRHGTREIVAILQPLLDRTAIALRRGGVHTPNHRWVLCAAMAQIHALDKDPALRRRIDQWLAEGIDIDEDGQFDERSTVVYNPVTDRALVTIAAKLKRPELLEFVRRNLNAALVLVHPGGEMVTEISRRQDRDSVGNIGAYWHPMHYLAIHDRNGQYAAISRRYMSTHAGLSYLMEYPELLGPLPADAPVPDNFEKHMRSLDVVRIRRGDTSATILLRDDSRFFMLRRGDAVIRAVRFASAFFGKAQFIPRAWARKDGSYVLSQSLDGPYFQPLDPPHAVGAMQWGEVRPERTRTEVGHLEQSASITELPSGFRLRLQAHGTRGVPVAVEISVRGQDGLRLDGLHRAPGVEDGFLLPAGYATVKAGNHQIRFGPGRQQNRYTQIRGAEPKLAGASVYLTGFTPFDHTLDFEVS